jgi:hypothetical protein
MGRARRRSEFRKLTPTPPPAHPLIMKTPVAVLTPQRQLPSIFLEGGVYAASTSAHQGTFGFLFAIVTLGALKQRQRRAPREWATRVAGVLILVWTISLLPGAALGAAAGTGPVHFEKRFLTDRYYCDGISTGDFNRDGRLDLILNEGWYEQPRDRNAPWARHEFLFAEKGGAQMFAMDVNGDGRQDVVTSLDAHGWGLAWFEQEEDRNNRMGWKAPRSILGFGSGVTSVSPGPTGSGTSHASPRALTSPRARGA